MLASADLELDITGGRPDYWVSAHCPTLELGDAGVPLQLPLDETALEQQLRLVQHAVLASSARVRRRTPAEEQPVQHLGRALFDATVTGAVRDLYRDARQQATRQGVRLRVMLRIHPSQLAHLPWEFLYDPDAEEYVALARPLLRAPPVAGVVRRLPVTPPLQILGMVARPDDADALAVDAEQQRLAQALSGLERDGLVQLTWVPGQTWRDLQQAMHRSHWHVFHFIGHGGFDRATDEGLLALADDQGATYELHASDLALLVCDHASLRLVLLNACDTARASALDSFSSTAGGLVRRGVPAVLAMQYQITDTAAIELAHSFYSALASQLPVDVAVTEARRAVKLAHPNSLEWGTPMLYLRGSDGRLFDLTGAAPRRQQHTQLAPDSETAGKDSPESAVLYTDALAAYYTEQWEAAVEAFRELLAHQPDHHDAAVKLEQARRHQLVAARYAAAVTASEDGAWPTAIEHLQAVLASEPSYRDAEQRLAWARQQQTLGELHDQARRLHQAGKWQAVIAVGEQLAALEPAAADPDGLVTSARAELAAAEQARTLAGYYAQALAHVDRDAWTDALRALEAIQAIDPGYRDSGALLARVRRELAPTGPPRSPTLVTTISIVYQVRAVTFSPDSRLLALAASGENAMLFEAATGEWQRSIRHGWVAHVLTVAFSPDGRRLATGADGRPVRVWDANTGNKRLEVRHEGLMPNVYAVVFSPDGQWLATGAQDKTARIWDTNTGQQRRRLLHDDPVLSVAFSPDGRWLATGARDNTVRIWDTDTGQQRLQRAHDGQVMSVAFSPDGRWLATAGIDKTARIWDTNTGHKRLTVAHDGPIGSVAFSPDGRWLATGADDKTARIWDANTGQERHRLPHDDPVTSVAFNPDGRWLATGSGLAARVWQLSEAPNG